MATDWITTFKNHPKERISIPGTVNEKFVDDAVKIEHCEMGRKMITLTIGDRSATINGMMLASLIVSVTHPENGMVTNIRLSVDTPKPAHF